MIKTRFMTGSRWPWNSHSSKGIEDKLFTVIRMATTDHISCGLEAGREGKEDEEAEEEEGEEEEERCMWWSPYNPITGD